MTKTPSKEVYRFYAEAVAGVRGAKIIRAPRGPGSTDVIVASVAGLPTPELVQAVETNLYDHELMCFDVQVKPPVVTNIVIEIEYSGGADEADVALVAERYVRDLGIGGRFRKNELYRLYDPMELSSVEILSPERDVQTAENAIIVAAIAVTKTGA